MNNFHNWTVYFKRMPCAIKWANQVVVYICRTLVRKVISCANNILETEALVSTASGLKTITASSEESQTPSETQQICQPWRGVC